MSIMTMRTGGNPVNADSRGEPTAVAVDLGSGQARIWAVGHGTRNAPSIANGYRKKTALVRRGRIVDAAGCVCLLTELSRELPGSLPPGSVVVACRPVRSTPSDDDALRRVMRAVFAPSQVLLIDTVRAAALGCAAAPGVLMVVDVGAQLTEVAVLAGSGVAAARRAELGVNDLIRPSTPDVLVDTIVRLVGDLRGNPGSRALVSTAVQGGLLLIGGGASLPGLAAALAGALGTAARSAARPRVAAVHGAGLAALSVLQRTAATY
jgi:rod shape-determining protein MreB